MGVRFADLTFGQVTEMAINGFKPEEKLYGSSNFYSWKARLTNILDENDLDDIVRRSQKSQQQMLVGLLTRGSKVRLGESSMILSESH